MTRTADDIWRAVAADIDAMHAPFGGASLTASVDKRTADLMRIAAAAGYRLATADAAERIRIVAEDVRRHG